MTVGTLGPVLLAVLALLGLAVLAMAIGVMFKRPCLRGSCGGSAVHDANGQKLSCDDCPNRHKHDAA